MEEFGGLGGLSATGILVVMVLKVVFDYVKSRDEASARAERAGNGDDCARDIEEQLKLLRETQARTALNCEKMAEVLSAKDSEGLPLVYTPRSLGKSIESLSQSISKLSDHVQAG
mgnify:CR=1 FL=1